MPNGKDMSKGKCFAIGSLVVCLLVNGTLSLFGKEIQAERQTDGQTDGQLETDSRKERKKEESVNEPMME
jgi:hypothetical protein